jgi:hypothetical protein
VPSGCIELPSVSWTGHDHDGTIRRDHRGSQAAQALSQLNEPLTTKPDHNRIRQQAIPADAPMATAPGERLYPTSWAYFASRGPGVRVPLAPCP